MQIVKTTVLHLFALSPERNKKFLKTSVVHSMMEACEYVRHLDLAGKSADSASDKKQKADKGLLRDAMWVFFALTEDNHVGE